MEVNTETYYAKTFNKKWIQAKLGDLIDFKGGSQPPRFTFIFRPKEGYVRLLQIRDYKSDKYATYIPESLAKNSCSPDDIMIGRYGPPIFQILKGLSGAYNVALIKAEPKDKLDKTYAFYFLKQDKLFEFVEKLSQRSSGQTGIDLQELKNYPFPLPPTLQEQTAIATALSDTDALITSLEKIIAKKRNIKQGAMQELLKPKKGWEVKTYDEAFDFLPTANYSRAELNGNAEIGYIHYGDIHTKWNDFLDVKTSSLPGISAAQLNGYSLIKEGDVIMADASEDYAGIGKSIEVRNVGLERIISGLHTFLLRDKNDFFANGFKGYIHLNPSVKKQMDRLATGLKVYGISKTNLKMVQIPIPPKEEQFQIASILGDMDSEIKSLESKLEKYREIKSGMMQNLLTGKIRLV